MGTEVVLGIEGYRNGTVLAQLYGCNIVVLG
jgi:hypothetical protein